MIEKSEAPSMSTPVEALLSLLFTLLRLVLVLEAPRPTPPVSSDQQSSHTRT